LNWLTSFLLRVELGLDLGELRLENSAVPAALALAHLQVLLDEEDASVLVTWATVCGSLPRKLTGEGDGAR